jgi:hypothetical protein
LKQAKVDGISALANSVFTKIRPHLKDFTSSATDRADLTVEAVDRLITQYQAAVAELRLMTQACEQAVTRIARFLQIPTPKTSTIPGAVLTLLAMLDRAQNPLASLLGEVEGKYQTTVNAIHVFANRLRGVADYHADNATLNLSAQELTVHTLDLLHDIQDRIETSERQIALLEGNVADFRQSLESHDVQMHKFLKEEDVDLRQFSIRELIERTNKLCEQITHPNASDDFLHVRDITALFSSIFTDFGLSEKSDPRRFIPDICERIVLMLNSLNALHPFRVILNEVWTMVDRNADSMKAGTVAYERLGVKISELNQRLKEISPVKVETIVLTTLQKFTTLVSGLFAAIASEREAFVTRETV